MFVACFFSFLFFFSTTTNYNAQMQEYKAKSYETAVKSAKAAVKYGVTKFVEVSTAQIYESSSKVCMHLVSAICLQLHFHFLTDVFSIHVS